MKVGFLGTGGIAVKMANTINRMDGIECYAIASRTMEKAEAFGREFGFIKAFGSYEEMMQDDEVELVYIATPNSKHYEDALLCIRYGKHMLCEKAFMANAAQAEEVIRLAKEKGLFMTEAVWTRFMPSRKLIDEVIESGKIGDIISLTANLGYDIKDVDRLTNPALAGGALLDVGVYPMHFADMILGTDVESSASMCTKTETGVDAVDAIVYKYKTGRMSVLHCSILEVTDQYGIIYGSKGYIIAKNINNIDKIEIYNPDRELVEVIDVPEQISGYEYQLLAVQKAIEAGKTECDESPLRNSLEVMKQMDELRKEWGVKFPFE